MGRGFTVVEEEVLRNYRGLTVDDIRRCLRCASGVLRAEKVYLLEV